MSGIKLTIAELVKRQRDYFKTSATKNVSTRIETLKLLKRGIMAFEPRLSEALKKDLGKSEAEVIATEIGITIQEINSAIKGAQKWSKQNPVPTNWMNVGTRSFVVKEPYGTCLIIAPWNYPFQLAISPLIGAIVAGNTVVLKPSEVSDHTSIVIKDLFDTFFDPRQVAVVLGGVAVTSELLEERFDKIFFTGSSAVGSIIMEKAGRYLTPVTLNLGGKSPCIVDKTCDLELAAKRIIFGKGINAGQTCVAPDYVLVHETVKTQFVEIFKETIELFYGEAPHLNQNFGQIINERHFKRLKSYLGDGEILSGGDYNEQDRRIDITLIEVSDPSLPIMQDEIFGPVLPLMAFENIEDIVQIIQRNPDPLALYVFSNHQAFIDQLILRVPFGGCCVNDTIIHAPNEHLSFGGLGTSSIGRYHGKHSFDTFTHEKSILVSSTAVALKQKYPQYAKQAMGILKKTIYR